MEEKRKLTPEMKVEILYNNLIGLLETFEFLDNDPFSNGMLVVIKPTLIILTAETVEDLQEEVDKAAFAITEFND